MTTGRTAPMMAALLAASAGTGAESWTLHADLDAPKRARDLAAQTVSRLPIQLVEDVRVVASELATNAVRYSRLSELVLAVEVTSTEVVVTVADSGNDVGHVPRIDPADREEGGMGLGICARLGRLHITGQAATGWQVAVRIPLINEEATGR